LNAILLYLIDKEATFISGCLHIHPHVLRPILFNMFLWDLISQCTKNYGSNYFSWVKF